MKTSNKAKNSYIQKLIATQNFCYFLRATMTIAHKNFDLDIIKFYKLKAEI